MSEIRRPVTKPKIAFFPTLKFVDEMPKKSHRDEGLVGVYSHTEEKDVNGFYHNEIFVLKRKGAWKVLLHELCHWLIDITCGETSHLHIRLDKKGYERVHAAAVATYERKQNELKR